MLWFPTQRFSVVSLCNNGSANPTQLARQVAEIYLSSEMTVPPAATQRSLSRLAPTAEEVRAKAGLFRSEDRGYLEIVDRDGKLYRVGAPGELIALDKYRFTANDAPEGLELAFDDHSPATSFELKSPGGPSARYERVEPITLSENEAKAYAGEFESRELGATCRISADVEGVSLEMGDRPAVRLQSAGPERMRTATTGVELVFHRDGAGNVSGFYLNAGRVRKLLFQRM